MLLIRNTEWSERFFADVAQYGFMDRATLDRKVMPVGALCETETAVTQDLLRSAACTDSRRALISQAVLPPTQWHQLVDSTDFRCSCRRDSLAIGSPYKCTGGGPRGVAAAVRVLRHPLHSVAAQDAPRVPQQGELGLRALTADVKSCCPL